MQRDIHMTYYGTGCIFHYDDDFPVNSGKGFMEADKPNFTGSYYSYTKVKMDGAHQYVCIGGITCIVGSPSGRPLGFQGPLHGPELEC